MEPNDTNPKSAPAQPSQPVEPTPSRPSIHTLEGDLYSALKDENYSSNIVKIATKARSNTTQDSSTSSTNKPSRKTIIILVSVGIFILLLIVVSVLLVMNKNTAVDLTGGLSTSTPTGLTTPVTIKNSGVLTTEAIIKLDLKNLNKIQGAEKIYQIQQELKGKEIAPGAAVSLDLNLTTGEFFLKNQYSGDDALIRALSTQYSFGIYNNKDGIFESFVVFKVDEFDQAFAAMLSWESYISVDLKEFYTDSTATTTIATTTPDITPTAFVFKDRIIQNTDARVHTDPSGKIDFVYGFINKNYLIVSGGIESFLDLKTRLLNNNTLR